MNSNTKDKLMSRMQKSLGFIDLYLDEIDYPHNPISHKGFLCGDNRTFLSCPTSLLKAKIVKIRFLGTVGEHVPVATFHDTNTGVTTFTISPVPGMEPLYSGYSYPLKQGTNLFVPNYSFCAPIHDFIPGKLMLPRPGWPNEDPHYINHVISALYIGCPLIDSKGRVIGIINRASELTKDEISEIEILLRLKRLRPKVFKDKFFSSLIARYNLKMASAYPVMDIPF